jgi:hypothetical protein
MVLEILLMSVYGISGAYLKWVPMLAPPQFQVPLEPPLTLPVSAMLTYY